MKNLLIIQLSFFSFMLAQVNTVDLNMKEFVPAGKIEALIEEGQVGDFLLVQLNLKNDSLFNLVNSTLPKLDLFSGAASYHRIMSVHHLEKIKNVLTDDYYDILNEKYVVSNSSREFWVDFKQGDETQGTWSDDDAIEYTCACLSGASNCVKLGWDESWYNPFDYWGEAWYGFQPPFYQEIEEIRVTVRGAQCDALPVWSETYMGMMDANGNWSQDYELSIDYTDNEYIVGNTWNGSMLMPRIGSEDNYCIDSIKLEFFYSCETPSSPSNLLASDKEDCYVVDLAWSLPDDPIEQQILYRDGVAIAQLDALDVYYEDWGAQGGIDHVYCIEAHNECGVSSLTCNPGSIKVAPNIVSNVMASDGEYDNIVLINWSASEYVDDYKIYRDQAWLGIMSFDQLEYSDIIAEIDVFHEYCIEALNDCGASDWVCDIGYISSLGGDINEDGSLDVLDIVVMVNIIIEVYDPTEDELLIADLNDDGFINILDIVILVNTILTY